MTTLKQYIQVVKDIESIYDCKNMMIHSDGIVIVISGKCTFMRTSQVYEQLLMIEGIYSVFSNIDKCGNYIVLEFDK